MTTVSTKDYPILFSGPMVKAILDGTKTQTRRVVKPQPVWEAHDGVLAFDDRINRGIRCPYGQPGDRLWVRETWAVWGQFRNGPGYCYRADGDLSGVTWKPSIHMPRGVSRITLEITEVRAERLQSISYEDCCRETGAPLVWPGPGPAPYPRQMHQVFAELWDKINGKRADGTCSWASNPWVWAISFRPVDL